MGDLAAGLTVGAMLVPQAMAYAQLAGLPPEVGLYSATIPLVLYALFGTSRQLAVGPVAIVSLLTAAALAPVAEIGTEEYLVAASVLAVMVGVVHLVLGLGRLGCIVKLLSHPVLVGFTGAAALIIGMSQLSHLFGITGAPRDSPDRTAMFVIEHLGQTNPATLAIGLGSLICLVGLKRLAPRVPAALVVVAGSISAFELGDLGGRGVAVIGEVPASLPTFAIPAIDGSIVGSLVGTAVVITLIGVMESTAVATTVGRRHGHTLDPNRELIGLGAANLGAGLFGGYPVTGGLSRTAVNDQAGARSQLASIVTAAVVLTTIGLFTPLFASLPNAALAAIILSAVAGLIDLDEARRIVRSDPGDALALGTAVIAVLAAGVERGVLIAMVVAWLVHLVRVLSRPESRPGRILTEIFPYIRVRPAEQPTGKAQPVTLTNHPVDQYETQLTEGAQFVDVREPDEVAGGALAGTANIPLTQLAQRIDELDPTRRVLLLCQSGGRSAKASDFLVGMGFSDVVNLEGGMSQLDKSRAARR